MLRDFRIVTASNNPLEIRISISGLNNASSLGCVVYRVRDTCIVDSFRYFLLIYDLDQIVNSPDIFNIGLIFDAHIEQNGSYSDPFASRPDNFGISDIYEDNQGALNGNCLIGIFRLLLNYNQQTNILVNFRTSPVSTTFELDNTRL